ncbi:MAG TPA: thrombospondin type 3 repeat-containing protein [Acidimicrobiia bacterium]|nr:thrombospondin type 3 repeat-containing protein [Acidimicrobiia bacterium]HTC80833.1 thrombospondin type 3 repeat-containing protein [Acidimicrobiia bacterium]
MDTQSARRFAPARLGAIAVLSALLSMAGFAVLVSPAMGKPDYLAEFNKKYDTRGSKLDSCNTCHTTPQDAQHLNPYGADFGKHNHDFGAIEPLDSDGDGFSNIDEIKAGTFPGDPNDNPNTKSKPKAPPSTTTTTKPFPFSLLPSGLPHVGSAGTADTLLAILDGRR